MISTRLANLAGRVQQQSARLTLQKCRAAQSVRAVSSTRTATPSGRVHVAKSRADAFTSTPDRRKASLAEQCRTLKTFAAASAAQGPTLQSAFPKKTVGFLVILGAAIYYFADFIEELPPNWIGEAGDFPLHFYYDQADIQNMLENHVQAVVPVRTFTVPEVLDHLNQQFSIYAQAWEITPQLAQKEDFNIPATHGMKLRSNDPCEDFHAIGTAPGPGQNPWNYWSIYDGHAGRECAWHLQTIMHPTLSLALSSLSPYSPSAEIHRTIKDTFVAIDNDLMQRAKHAGNWLPAASPQAIAVLAPAFSGSCALLAAFDPETNKLRVACVGDSRAVLGRWDPLEQKYIAQPLSVDQTGFNEAEVARIKAAHPEEDDIMDPKSGRLMGLAVSRAFGDHRWKWENSFIKQLQLKFWGTAPRPQSRTPPYLTAEPEITETDIVRAAPGDRYARSDFMIMASDGLWDHMSNEVAVECVERWLEARDRGNGFVSQDPQVRPANFNNVSSEVGIEYDVEGGQEVTWKAEPRFFAIEDDNAAICLARNAMGGTRRGLFLGLLTLPASLRRSAIDDTTVMVVFFDKTEEGAKKGGDAQKKKRTWGISFSKDTKET